MILCITIFHLIWQGEDGYHISMRMPYPVTIHVYYYLHHSVDIQNIFIVSEINKKTSSMNYYSYRLIVRENEDTHILKILTSLSPIYAVDMKMKVETE